MRPYAPRTFVNSFAVGTHWQAILLSDLTWHPHQACSSRSKALSAGAGLVRNGRNTALNRLRIHAEIAERHEKRINRGITALRIWLAHTQGSRAAPAQLVRVPEPIVVLFVS